MFTIEFCFRHINCNLNTAIGIKGLAAVRSLTILVNTSLKYINSDRNYCPDIGSKQLLTSYNYRQIIHRILSMVDHHQSQQVLGLENTIRNIFV